MNNCKVSIIIPTRNRKELLLDAVKSALNQTCKNIQLVVHDNNSVDGTKEFILNQIHDERMEFYRVDHDLTMTENWNRAFSYVQGDYFLRLDDDNVITNDFIEDCLIEIEKNNLDVITFSPLIVNLNNKSYSSFCPGEKIYLLNKFQIAFLEFFNLTDSNDTLYNVSLIKKTFPDGNIYKTTLPDRYMNYSLISEIENLRLGFSTKLKGLTRYDYRSSWPDSYKLKFVNYENIPYEDIIKSKDCQNNFYMHRIAALYYFLRVNNDQELKTFFNKKIVSPELYVTTMKLGHVYMAISAFSISELVVLNRYAISIIFAIIMNPLKKLEGRSSLINLIAISKNIFVANIKSIINIVFHKKREKCIIDRTFGNRIVNDILNGQDLVRYNTFSSMGNFKDLIKKIKA